MELHQTATAEQCQQLIEQVQALPDHLWRDRSRQFINVGIEGDVGHYRSVRHDMLPEAVFASASNIAPTLKPWQLLEFYINHYAPGDFIPPHRDHTAQGHLAMTVVSLQDNASQGLTIYADDSLQDCHVIPDVAGRAACTERLSTIHAVAPVQTDRYTLICLYR